MKDNLQIAEHGSHKETAATTPVREPDVVLTPRAEATASNKLPHAEQMKKFEQNLEAHDSGNQPA